jgi:hypothetical protein
MFKDKKGIVAFPLLILIIVLGVFGFFVYRSYKLNEKISSPGTVTVSEDAQKPSTTDEYDWEIFNSSLGFSFEYPKIWGTPTEKIQDAGEAGQGDSGKVYSLRFSENNSVYGSGKSIDFSAGRGGMRSDYKGDSSSEAGVDAYLDIVDPGCFTMGTQNTFVANIDFNLPGREISGVRIFFPVFSSEDITKIYSKFGISTQEADCWGDEQLAKKHTALGDEILLYVGDESNLSEETISNLNIFDHMSSSSKITTP